MKHRPLIFTLMCFLHLVLIAPAYSQTEHPDPPEHEQVWRFTMQPQMFGINLGIGYIGFPLFHEVDTTFWLLIGAAYQNVNFFRTADGKPLTKANIGNLVLYDDLSFERLSINWGCGISQGIVKDDGPCRNVIELFAFYRGRFDDAWSGNADSTLRTQTDPLPDTEGILQNTLVCGLMVNMVAYDSEKKMKSGIYAESSLEWGPEFFFNSVVGMCDFLRLNITFKSFLPLFGFSEKTGSCLMSMYLADCLIIDYLTGPHIPIHERQNTGGLNTRLGMGESVRGFEKGRFDAELRLIDNLELRIIFPSLIDSAFAPGMFIFLDSGYFYFREYENQGLVFSTGTGIFFIVMDKLQLTVYASLLLNEARLDGSTFVPVGFSMKYHF